MPPQGKRFYGSVTVSERGQVVIPADARKEFGINAGDKLLVFGDLEQGLAFATLDLMARNMSGAMDLFGEVAEQMNKERGPEPPELGER